MRKIVVAAAVLLAFTACRNGGQQAPAATGQEPEAAAAVEVRSERPNVAYIQIDSLMLDYLLAQDLSNAFQAKANKAERELNAKSQQLEKDMLEAQDKIQKGLVARATAEEMQQKLMQLFLRHPQLLRCLLEKLNLRRKKCRVGYGWL